MPGCTIVRASVSRSYRRQLSAYDVLLPPSRQPQNTTHEASEVLREVFIYRLSLLRFLAYSIAAAGQTCSCPMWAGAERIHAGRYEERAGTRTPDPLISLQPIGNGCMIPHGQHRCELCLSFCPLYTTGKAPSSQSFVKVLVRAGKEGNNPGICHTSHGTPLFGRSTGVCQSLGRGPVVQGGMEVLP